MAKPYTGSEEQKRAGRVLEKRLIELELGPTLHRLLVEVIEDVDLHDQGYYLCCIENEGEPHLSDCRISLAVHLAAALDPTVRAEIKPHNWPSCKEKGDG